MITTPTEAAAADQPTAEYRCAWSGVGLVCLLLSAVGVGVALSEVRTGTPDWVRLALSVGWALGCAGLALFVFLREGGRRWLLFEHGLLDRRRRRAELYRWDQIERFNTSYVTSHGITMLTVSLCCRDGRRLEQSGSPNLSRFTRQRAGAPPRISLFQLAQEVQQASYPHRLATAAARFDAGERLVFDKLGLSRTGLAVGRAELPWERVADLDLKGGKLVIMELGQSRPWRTAQWDSAPNADLVPALIERSQGRRFSAYRDIGATPLTESEIRALQWRQRVLGWVMPILGLALMIGLSLGVSYGRYWLSPRWHVDQGQSYLDAHQDAAALAEFEAALAQDPGALIARIGRGQAHHHLGHLDQALADYNAVLQAQPDQPLALVLRAQVYTDQGRTQEALDTYARVIAHSPRSSYPYCARGYTYHRLGQNQQALRDYTTCRDLATTQARRAEAQQIIERLGGQ